MKSRTLACGFVLGAATALLSTQVVSQEAESTAHEDMAQKYAEYARPGEYHDRLELAVGKWDSDFTIWMEGPDKPPMSSSAVVSNKLIFGGRFLETRLRGLTQMEINGETIDIPIEAVGYRGYDNFKKKYVSVWIDNGGTGIYYSEGTSDETGKVTTFFATIDEWQTGERDKPYKMVETIIDEDTVTMSMHDLTLPAGRDRIFQERSTRRKPPASKPMAPKSSATKSSATKSKGGK